jgi:ubiquitin-conjugating enzyme E2 G1
MMSLIYLNSYFTCHTPNFTASDSPVRILTTQTTESTFRSPPTRFGDFRKFQESIPPINSILKITHLQFRMSTKKEKTATLLLSKQLAELQKNPVEGFSAGLVDEGNVFEWELLIYGPTNSLYEGGMWKAILKFPKDYPDMGPQCYIKTPIWHPNVYKDGKVCISILHPPGDDEYGYEKASERWNPVLSVESILISIISMLSAPNIDSPANIEAATQFKDNMTLYKKTVKKYVEKSMDML